LERPGRLLLGVVFVAASIACACGGQAADTGHSRADSYQRNNPREGIGVSGDTGKAPRDMPGGGRGSAPPRGK
jgi:hypothetical protein